MARLATPLTWRTRPYRAQDRACVADFLTALGDDTFTSRLRGQLDAYYRWKYGDGAGDCDRVRLAIDRDGVVGMVAMLPRRLRIGGRVVTAFEMGDISTVARHRRQGIFSTLGREACETAAATAALTYVKPNGQSAPILERQLGFDLMVEMRTFARPLRVSRLLANRLGRALPGTVGRPLDRLFAVRPPGGGVSVARESVFGDEFDRLWDGVAADYPAIVVRDRAYLTWRFRDNPTPYAVFTARDGSGRLLGYAVGLVVQSGRQRIGYLVDILTPVRDWAAQQALVRGVVQACAAEGADSVHTWVVSQRGSVQWRLRAVLASLGFLPRSRGRVLWRPSDERLGLERRAWYLTMADFDGI